MLSLQGEVLCVKNLNALSMCSTDSSLDQIIKHSRSYSLFPFTIYFLVNLKGATSDNKEAFCKAISVGHRNDNFSNFNYELCISISKVW